MQTSYGPPGERLLRACRGCQDKSVPTAEREEIDLRSGLPLVGLEMEGDFSVDNLQFGLGDNKCLRDDTIYL